jgi:hypothetical protein
VPVYVFISGAVITPIILRVKEDIIIGSRVVANVIIIIALRVVVGVDIAIIVVIIIRRFLRACALISLLSLIKGVFISFAF